MRQELDGLGDTVRPSPEYSTSDLLSRLCLKFSDAFWGLFMVVVFI
jgi:hypothetical protein